MILRELFSKIVVDVKAAIANVNRFDAAMDEAGEGLEKAEKDAKGLGKELENTGKRGEKFGRGIARAFKNAGRAAFNARGQIKDAGIGIGKAFAVISAGATGVTVIAGNLTLAWAEQAQELDNLSRMYQISTDDIQGFTGALRVMGLDAEDGLETIKELRIRLGEAKREGTTPLREALLQLGVSFDSFSALPLADQLGVLADRMSEVTDESEKNQIANDIAGDDLIKILPLIDLRAEGIAKLTKRAKELNLVQSKESIAAGKKLFQSWKSLNAIFKSVRNFVANKLQPSFLTIIETTSRWIRENRQLITSGIVDFIERLVNVTADFLPVAIKFADGLLKIVEGLGGVKGAITAVVGAMFSWKVATAALLGPAGPWIAGLIAVTAALRIFGQRVDAEDRRITRLANKRRRGLRFRQEREFTTQELEQLGGPGQEVLRLEKERADLIFQRSQTGVGTDIDQARKDQRAFNERQLTSGGRERLGELNRRTLLFEKQIDQSKRLEEAIRDLDTAIEEQLGFIRTEARAKDKDRTRDRALVSAEAILEDKRLRARSRDLLALFKREKLDEAGKVELRQILFALGLKEPEGLTPVKPPGGAKKEKVDPEEEIRKLIGLGPEGIKTISDLVPKGQGTTINNFSFSTRVEAPKVTINITTPEGTSPAAVAQTINERLGRVITDIANQDQRALVGQLQG